MSSTDPDLTREEVDRICSGLVQNAAKIRYLRSLGLHVERRPDGTPLVNRAHYDKVRGAAGQRELETEGAGPVWGVH